MQSPFIIFRYVSFALLINFNLLVLVFASWNASATVTYGLSVSLTTAFLLFDSCASFFFISLALVELAVPQAKTSRVSFECCWSAILSLFQTGTAISITVNGPAICRQSSNWDLCASSSLLLVTSWLSSLLILSHFFMLFITTISHIRVHPNVWFETILTVNWFNQYDMTLWPEKGDKVAGSGLGTWYTAPKTPLDSSHDCEKAPWAQATNIRRGVDSPFKRPNLSSAAPNSCSTTLISLPVAPLRIQARNPAGSRFIEKFRESKILSRSGTPSQYGLHFENRVAPFPPRVDDHDLPIPLPRLSEWICADAINDINVHTASRSL
ncbi:hypothetical protein BDZ94DRAFT_1275426 [Collybia nuda]|uniref:Uncharacterized protein n=1 Tax=Collybia nuda TaxID=64659 RepID=A0A9P5XRU0_9AGAR|nr:hypothetical protein BDZ94DRAFT_1275426 [Collybia nuda]